MATYFGTDGIRGEYGKSLTPQLAFSVGNALTQIKQSPSVIIGCDTRVSSDILLLSVCSGILQGGGNAFSVKTIPTAGISYLSKDFDFGIIITASHNPAQYNGIKIFNNVGQKLNDEEEEHLEEFLSSSYMAAQCGRYIEDESLKQKYLDHLLSSTNTNLKNLKICLDASNGAGFEIAPLVFKKLGAETKIFNCTNNGKKINDNCGCLFIENLQKQVLKSEADVGFAFDGDADRVIAVDKNGDIFDGDKLLYILARHMQKNNSLNANSVVGTSQTNSGIAHALNRNKINLIRTDVGDKYVIEAMQKMNLNLGGEQAGHIIIKDFANTGDGILTAIKICEILKTENKTLSQFFDARLIPQINKNIVVKDKIKVMNNEQLTNLINKIANDFEPSGRILVRASGTEEKVRIMLEHPDIEKSQKYCEELCNLILNI